MQNRPQGSTLFVASAYGIGVFEQRRERWVQMRGGLDEFHVTSVAAHAGAILAGTLDGVYRSVDFGASWWPYNEGLADRHIRWIAYRQDGSGGAVVGTEPAAIYVSKGDGAGWRLCHEVTELRDRLGWYLPYSPEAGCVRGFAFHGARGYAAVEQGGLLRTSDGGESWRLVDGTDGVPRVPKNETMIHPDVHSITVHPSSPELLTAPTGGGLYSSNDGGATWRRLYDCYCRAVWVDPGRADHIIFGPADSVSVNGRIERSLNGGQTWQPVMGRLSDVWAEYMVERFYQVDGSLMAVLSNGELIAAALEPGSAPADLKWQVVLPSVQGVKAVATME